MTDVVNKNFARGKIFFASLFVLAIVVAITYHPALALNFYGDDYSFVEQAGRSSLGEQLAFYFDPRTQTGWYRPMQGMLFGIEWLVFGGNPLGYHAVNAFVHFCNSLLLYAIVSRVVRPPRVAFLAALIWSGLPPYGVAVFWPGDADFLLTFFYLLAICFWILFLQEKEDTSPQTVGGRSRPTLTGTLAPHWVGYSAGVNARLHFGSKESRWKIFSFLAFLLALTTKEFGVTVPVTLFLLDYFILRDRANPRALLHRYAPFLIVYAMYLPLELYIQSRSVLTNEYGYGIGAQIQQNLFGYLAALTFPWILPEPFSYIWLAIAVLALVLVSLTRKTVAPAVLALLAIIAFAPITPFPWFFHRYLYSAVMISAIILAWLINSVVQKFQARWVALATSAALACLVFSDGLGVAASATDFAEIGRQTRVPFRDFTQRHSTLAQDTYIYFISPPTITSQLSGMFFLRYGAGVRVASDEQATRANLREHHTAYVIYFDEQKRTREIAVEKNLSAQSNSKLPLDFGGVALRYWELASDRAKRGQAIILILYWDLPIEGDVRLVDIETGQAIAVAKGRARGAVADARILAIPLDARPGNYRVEIAVSGATPRVVIEPVVVSE